MRKRRDMLERERPRLEIVPMIDIMMFLLVFFVMIVLRMIPDSGVSFIPARRFHRASFAAYGCGGGDR